MSLKQRTAAMGCSALKSIVPDATLIWGMCLMMARRRAANAIASTRWLYGLFRTTLKGALMKILELILLFFMVTSPMCMGQAAGTEGDHLQKATFAGGCFWCMQPFF